MVPPGPVHGAEQSWRYAKSPFKSIVEPDRGQPDLGCDTLERQVAVDERARRFQTQGLDEMRRRLAGCCEKAAIEVALAQAGARGKGRHIERPIQIVLHPVDQAGERALRLDAGIQQRTELRLIARTPA